jgi:hypothetical protein
LAIKIQKENDANENQIKEIFPFFNWVIRDFSLKLEDKDGN